MTTNYSKYDMFAAYRNPDRIGNMIQNKISNITENEFLFPNVDYSHAYDDLIEKYSDLFDGSSNSTEETDGDGQNVDGENNSEGAEGTEDGKATEGGTEDGKATEGGTEDGKATEGGTEEGTIATDEQVKELREAYEQVEDEQGWLGKAWNGVKNFFGHSNGSDAVEEVLDKAENGEVTYEEAVEKLNTYSSKQGSFVDTFANVTSGLAVALGAVFSPFSFGATLAIGTAAGAAIKVGIKASDKATNDVEGDYKLKDFAKDGITGTVSSAVTVATAGIGSTGINLAKEGGKVAIKQVAVEGAKAGAKAGAIDGGVMGAANYIADAAFDGDEFSFGGLVKTTVTGTVAGAATGGIIGGIASGLTAVKVNRSASATEVADELIDEATDEATAQAAKEATQEATDEATAQAAKEATQEATDEATAQAAKEATQEATDEATAQVAQTGANGTAKQASQNTTGDSALSGQQKKKVYKSNGHEAKTQAQRNSVLKNKVQNKEILNLQDAYEAGFTESEVKASGLYNKLSHASNATQTATQAAQEATDEATAQAAKEAAQEATDEATAQAAKEAANAAGVEDSSKGIMGKIKNTYVYNEFSKRVKNLASNVNSLKNKTPSEIKDALVGKAGATKQEFVDAYKLLQDTDEYKTNLLFRSVLDKAYDTINS